MFLSGLIEAAFRIAINMNIMNINLVSEHMFQSTRMIFEHVVHRKGPLKFVQFRPSMKGLMLTYCSSFLGAKIPFCGLKRQMKIIQSNVSVDCVATPLFHWFGNGSDTLHWN